MFIFQSVKQNKQFNIQVIWIELLLLKASFKTAVDSEIQVNKDVDIVQRFLDHLEEPTHKYAYYLLQPFSWLTALLSIEYWLRVFLNSTNS